MQRLMQRRRWTTHKSKWEVDVALLCILVVKSSNIKLPIRIVNQFCEFLDKFWTYLDHTQHDVYICYSKLHQPLLIYDQKGSIQRRFTRGLAFSNFQQPTTDMMPRSCKQKEIDSTPFFVAAARRPCLPMALTGNG